MSDDLVKRLRVKAGCIEMFEPIAWGSDTSVMREAADRIEQLELHIVGLEEAIAQGRDRIEQLEAELREARFQSLADLCQVEEAYDAQMKAEAENARLREAGRFLIERLMEFELSDNAEDMCREYMGHVEPAAERLKIALESSNFSEKVQLDDGK